jgi:quinol monooxygenase YgiN
MMSVVVVATIRPLPEHRDEVIAEFSATIAKVHAEDGCELYALNQADDRLIMIEKWASPEALATHSKAANLAALNPKLAGKVAGPPEVIVLQAVPAGDPAKGQV